MSVLKKGSVFQLIPKRNAYEKSKNPPSRFFSRKKSIKKTKKCFLDNIDSEPQNKLISYSSHCDTLTGLPNRSSIKQHLSKAIGLANRAQQNVALFYLDIDNFGKINDTFGHTKGDFYLRVVAQKLLQSVPENCTVVRLGNDEFGIITGLFSNSTEIIPILHAIQKELNTPIILGDYEIHNSASIGISVYPSLSHTDEDMIRSAGIALHQARQLGGNQYHFFNQSTNTKANQHSAIENDIINALNKNQFTLYYQPKVDTFSRKICGFEALIRWQHPSKGLLYPNQFIPIAEQTGLIVPISEWTIRTACIQIKQWENENFISPHIAVNISALHLHEHNFAETVEVILKETGANSKFLEFEITEKFLINQEDTTFATLHKLRTLGIKISIDDFGTGYSSLSYLRQFPIDSLKIDQSFIQNVTSNENDASITSTIITLAHNLGINVIAEGIEYREQAEFLQTKNCNELQGNYFSPPRTVPALTTWLKSNDK